MCHYWEAYKDWDLIEICDDEAEKWVGLRGKKTIDDFMEHAIENLYDGFTIYTKH